MSNSENPINSIEIKYMPIFDQAAPGVWTDFARIQSATQVCYFDEKIFLRDVKNDWTHGKHNFAFGAYNGTEMIGFVRGKCKSDGMWAEITELFVLPEFQGQHVGCCLLSKGEAAASMGAKKVRVHTDVNAGEYFLKHNYKADKVNPYTRFTKEINKTCALRAQPVFWLSPKLHAQCKDATVHVHPVFGSISDKTVRSQFEKKAPKCSMHHVNVKHAPMWIYVMYEVGKEPKIAGFIQKEHNRGANMRIIERPSSQTVPCLQSVAKNYMEFTAAQRKANRIK